MHRIIFTRQKPVISTRDNLGVISKGVMLYALVSVLVGGALLTPVLAGEEVKVGAPAPDFTLTDTDGKTHKLSDYTGEGYAVVLEWFNPDCPFIKMHHQANKTMNDLYARVKEQKVIWLAINSNAPGKQGNGLERNQKARKEYDMEMAILLDEDGKVGKLYQAKTTPHMFLVGADGILLYDGAIDNSKGSKMGETNYVAEALTAYLGGEDIVTTQTQPYGCSVKYAN